MFTTDAMPNIYGAVSNRGCECWLHSHYNLAMAETRSKHQDTGTGRRQEERQLDWRRLVVGVCFWQSLLVYTRLLGTGQVQESVGVPLQAEQGDVSRGQSMQQRQVQGWSCSTTPGAACASDKALHSRLMARFWLKYVGAQRLPCRMQAI